MTRLFVYGTLKRGFCRAKYLADETFVSVAKTQPLYRLLDCGSYPALCSDGKTSIVGELYDVSESCLKRLDVVEAVAEGLYARGTVQLAEPSRHGEKAVTYFYQAETNGLPEIPDGRW